MTDRTAVSGFSSPSILISHIIHCARCSACLLQTWHPEGHSRRAEGEECVCWLPLSASWGPGTGVEGEHCSFQHVMLFLLLCLFLSWLISAALFIFVISDLFPNSSENHILSTVVGMCKDQPLGMNRLNEQNIYDNILIIITRWLAGRLGFEFGFVFSLFFLFIYFYLWVSVWLTATHMCAVSAEVRTRWPIPWN